MSLVQRPTYPYTESPPLDDVMSLLYGRSITWGSEPRLYSLELTELNFLMFRIAYHSIFPISPLHTIPIDRCIFLYAFITGASMCFPSLFIHTIVEIHRNNTRKQRLYFPHFICRILNYLELEHFPSSELVHLTAPIRATFLKQCNAQKKPAEPSEGTTKRPRVEPSREDVSVDPIAAVADDDEEDDDDVDVAAAGGPSRSSPSPRSCLREYLRCNHHIIS